MDDSKTLGILFLVLASFGLYLQTQGKLLPALEIVTGPDEGKQPVKLGEFVVAIVVYLFVLSFLSPNNAMTMTVIVILGALLVNNRKMGKDDLLTTLFK